MRRTLFPLAIAALHLVTTAPVAAQPTRSLSGAEVAEDLRVMRVALETVHPGYLRYATRRQLDTAWARLGRRVQGGVTDAELYRETALLLALIRCNHTKAELPTALAGYRDTAATFLPFRFRIVEGRMQTLTAAPGLARGSIVTAINGVAADSVLAVLRRYVSVDGYTDHTRDALLGADSDLLGSDFDHYYPLVFGAPTVWRLDVETRGTRGARRVTIAPIRYPAWRALDGALVTRAQEFGATRWRMVNDTTALLTVPSFVNYRAPLDADSVMNAIFGELRRRGARHLVLDLRDNSGGSSDAMEALLRQLTHRPLQARAAIVQRAIRFGELPRHVTTWGDRRAIFEPDSSRFTLTGDGEWQEVAAAPLLLPAANAFTGAVSVLTSAHNASGATMLLALLQQLGAETGRLRLVGEATGGSAEGPTAGQILFVKLPASGITVRVPVKRTVIGAPFIRGMGVTPDVEIAPRAADVAAGTVTDRVLAHALTSPFAPASGVPAMMTGHWRGALEYRDYGTGGTVRLPVEQRFARTERADLLSGWIVYDDGPGKTIVSRERTRVDSRAGRWTESSGDPASRDTPTAYAMTTSRAGDTTIIVLRGSGTDDDRPVALRYTVRITPRSLERLKEFRRPGGAWEFRHVYRLDRVERAGGTVSRGSD